MVPAYPQSPRFSLLRAWAVHLYTATALILSLLAVNAIVEKQAFATVIFMAIAMAIDGTDGILARRWEVKKWIPTFDGRKLDDIIDYLTYTFIPVFFMNQFQIVSGPWQMVSALVLLASAYGFCNEGAKTAEGFFTGFPSYWNGVALYLYWLSWPGWLAGVILLLLGILTFVPVRYISLNQTIQWRGVTRTVLLLWAILLLIIMFDFENPNQRLVYLSLFFPGYYFLASLYLHNTITRS